ncbi:MAG: zinc-binding alcohol dehydrogenase [Caldilineaceae bacterium]|nr:zinc-binding alcohol dehydrogenase [Caldilineaceae bacterium]
MRRSVYFTGPRQAAVVEETLPAPAPGEVLVETLVSAISPGTEMLFYRGQLPAGLAVDTSIASLAGSLAYPLKYGYACVGRVAETGPDVADTWRGQRVFAFHPHESHFCAPVATLLPLPTGMDTERASLLPNAETAVNLVMDGAPLVGERVVVFGLGIVGLLTTALLAQFPLAALDVFDPIPQRRALARTLGASHTFDPADTESSSLDLSAGHGTDLIFELSGQPAALDQAVQMAGFGARIVIGSWYGNKRASLDLGEHFHRNRIQLVSSQVSTIAPGLTGRWSKARRMESAWRFLADLPIERLITHRFPVEEATAAYQLIDQQPEQTVQVVLDYR